MLGVALYSLLISSAPEARYVVYILEHHITDANKEKIRALQQDFPCEIHFISIHEHLVKYVSEEVDRFIWPTTMFGRFFLPSLLSEEDKALYLDIDTLIMHDLGELYNQPLDGAVMGAVYEGANVAGFAAHLRELGIPASRGYFNSGVLLMDLRMMREEGVEAKLLEYLQEHTHLLRFPDQDVLNAVLFERVKPMHPKWNWPPHHTRLLSRHPYPSWGNMGEEVARKAACNPSIIHFIGKDKPVYRCSTFYNELYRSIWRRSPWGDRPVTGKRWLHAFFKTLRCLPNDMAVRRILRREQQKAMESMPHGE